MIYFYKKKQKYLDDEITNTRKGLSCRDDDDNYLQ